MHASHMVRVTARMPSRLRDALARAAAARLVPIAAYVRESLLRQLRIDGVSIEVEVETAVNQLRLFEEPRQQEGPKC